MPYKIKSKLNPKRTKKQKIKDAISMIKLMGIPIIKVNLEKFTSSPCMSVREKLDRGIEI